jgi:hypothetical protein
VLIPAISNEFWSAVVSSGMSKSSRYHCSVKPCHAKLNRPFGSLNPNRIITTMGTNRYAMTAPV